VSPRPVPQRDGDVIVEPRVCRLPASEGAV
jgi:hypothetical protein